MKRALIIIQQQAGHFKLDQHKKLWTAPTTLLCSCGEEEQSAEYVLLVYQNHLQLR